MKKRWLITGLCAAAIVIAGVTIFISRKEKEKETIPAYVYSTNRTEYEVLDKEKEASFRFLWDSTNTNKDSKGYGLVLDRSTNPSMCSVASVGYSLAGYGIGVENKWITKEEGMERAVGTLKTMLENAAHVEGFFYHFLNMDSAERFGSCEVSVIDTAIFINGALFAGEYFGGEAAELAEQLYLRVNWNWYRNPETNQFYMEYKPENGKHTGSWGVYAEQLMLYFLGAASPTFPVPSDMLYQINRQSNMWIGMPVYIMSPANSMFTHQYSHAWYPLKNTVDNTGLDWYANSVAATLQSRQFSIDASAIFNTFGENSWGLTACDGPFGYSGGYGANPSNKNDGTIAPCGAAGSAPFAAKYVAEALEHFYTIDGLSGEYGLIDGYNLEGAKPKFMKDYLGIDKGISLVMLENEKTSLVWEYMSKNKYVKRGLKLAGITDANVRMIENADGTSNHKGFVSDSIQTEAVQAEESKVLSLTLDPTQEKQTWSLAFTPYQLDSELADFIAFDASGDAELSVSIFSENGTLIGTSDTVKINSKDLKPYKLDISSFRSSAESFASLTFSVQSKSDKMIMDEIRLEGGKNRIRNVVLSERPYVGSELYAEYDYLSVDQSEETYVTYEWQISDNPKNTYTKIEGADQPFYTPTEEDVGKFIRLLITPVDKKGQPLGQAGISINNCAVTKEQPRVSSSLGRTIESNKRIVK